MDYSPPPRDSTPTTKRLWPCSIPRNSVRPSTSPRSRKAVREAYGRTTYGQGCLLAADWSKPEPDLSPSISRTTSADKSTTEGLGHPRIQQHADVSHHRKISPPDHRADLADVARGSRQRGLLERAGRGMGEFGRTPRINDNASSATIGRNATPRSSPAAASGAASSMAHPTRPVPIRQRTLSAPTTWPQPSIICWGSIRRPRLRYQPAPAFDFQRQAGDGGDGIR